ncbi:hypothetical protein BGZ46_005827 [Entomortierella lignicola]|nr:hypothetical protein BGZ46_005827 [Entomortierella lignicola]
MSSLNEAPLDNVVDYVEKKPEEEEPFVFVSRKKNGQRRGNSSTTPLPTETKTTFKENKGNMQNSGNELPGWTSKKPGKIKKNSQRAKMLGLREEKTVEWGISMIEDRIVTLKQSKFYQAFQELVQLTIYPPCKKHQEHPKDNDICTTPSTPAKPTHAESKSSITVSSDGSNVVESQNANSVLPENRIKDMVFYGIGSVEISRNSQFQLALGLCLKDILQTTGTIYISDPIMTDFDKQLAEKLGIAVLQPEDKSKQQIEARTLLYMPHCPKGLYSQVLEANWSRNKLNDLVILGNRFTMYDESPSFRQVAKQALFILPALSIANVSLLPQIKFEDNTIFNDLALHCFPADRAVPEVDTHDREDDPECL